MEKTIKIRDIEIKLKATAGTMTRYRNQFNRDFLKDLVHLQEKMANGGNENQLESVDLAIFERIAWAMCKTADNTIPELEEWLDQFQPFDILQILPAVMELLLGTLGQVNGKERGAKRTAKSNKRVNANTLVLRCLKLGMSLSDMDNVTIGFVLDLVEENNREAEEKDEPTEADTETLYKFFK